MGACATRAPVLDPAQLDPATPAELEISDTPFIAQERYQCGPASLAMLLQHSGIEVSAEELRPQVYLPARKGSLQAEMLAAGRRYRRIPYRIEPSIAALAAELQAGRPVLVLQNLGLESRPRWHYAVVIGYRLEDDTIVLRSGTQERQRMPGWLFVKTWAASDNWAMVLLQPGQLPANPDRLRYLSAVAAAEAQGAPQAVLAAYDAALGRWPGDAIARFGRANALHALGRLDQASAVYQQLIAENPAHLAALNNLAEVYADLGCVQEAENTIRHALDMADSDNTLYPLLLHTRQEIRTAYEGEEQRECRRKPKPHNQPTTQPRSTPPDSGAR
jgi:tetratricopeptide (TPR) repeat protein